MIQFCSDILSPDMFRLRRQEPNMDICSLRYLPLPWLLLEPSQSWRPRFFRTIHKSWPWVTFCALRPLPSCSYAANTNSVFQSGNGTNSDVWRSAATSRPPSSFALMVELLHSIARTLKLSTIQLPQPSTRKRSSDVWSATVKSEPFSSHFKYMHMSERRWQ